MILGVDLDNTIVFYDRVFADAAIAAGLVAPDFSGGKHHLREALRAVPGGEERWQWLQARVYGEGMAGATPFDGFAEFAQRCRQYGIPLYVVSHKTEYAAADPGGVNLRDAARAWLERTFAPDTFAGVFFESTRDAKLARIAEIGCTHFVDDLVEVFAEPAFPASAARWLFDPAGSQPPLDAERFATWHELLERLEAERRVWTLAGRLAGAPIASLLRQPGGGNNQIFRVRAAEAEYALKLYGVPDDRGRLDREYAALQFVAAVAPGSAPEPVARDAAAGAGLYEWVDGIRPEAGSAEIEAALDFVERLHGARSAPGAEALAEAAEAGLRIAGVWRDVAARVERLRQIPELEPFLADFAGVFEGRREALRAVRDPEAPLDPHLRTLSPSDFGFHNALRRGDRIVFLDFEYFGWDDPVKLVADFTLHPATAPSSPGRAAWLAGTRRIFGQDSDFPGRLAAFYPTYALKWCLIVLNEFREEVWRRRVAAQPGLDWADAKAAQLAKARARIERVRAGEGIDGR